MNSQCECRNYAFDPGRYPDHINYSFIHGSGCHPECPKRDRITMNVNPTPQPERFTDADVIEAVDNLSAGYAARFKVADIISQLQSDLTSTKALLSKCVYLLECSKVNLEIHDCVNTPLHHDTRAMIENITRLEESR